MSTRTWKEIKDEVYGTKGTSRRDALDREFKTFKKALLLKPSKINATNIG